MGFIILRLDHHIPFRVRESPLPSRQHSSPSLGKILHPLIDKGDDPLAGLIDVSPAVPDPHRRETLGKIAGLIELGRQYHLTGPVNKTRLAVHDHGMERTPRIFM